MRLKLPAVLILGAIVGLIIVYATDQVVPASSAREAQLRLWLASRAAGITVELLLTAQVVLGLILSHPVNQSTWKLSKTIYPWHENLLVFTLAFLAAHVVSIILDPFAGVGLGGAFLPGLSAYRSAPVALGTLGLYAILVTGLTARYTKALPKGWWLKLHRLSLVAWILGWIHGMLAGTDSTALTPLYLGTGALVVFAAAYRYWVGRQAKRTFSTSLDANGRQIRGPVLAAEPLHQRRAAAVATEAEGAAR